MQQQSNINPNHSNIFLMARKTKYTQIPQPPSPHHHRVASKPVHVGAGSSRPSTIITKQLDKNSNGKQRDHTMAASGHNCIIAATLILFVSLSHLAPHFQQQQKAASGSGSISNRALSMNKAILPSLLATWQPSTVQADSPQ